MSMLVFWIALLAGLIEGRITVVSMRGGYQDTSSLRVIIGLASMLATFALLVWGFTHLAWYWPVLVIVVGIALQATLITRATLGVFLLAAPLFGLIAALGALWLWFLA